MGESSCATRLSATIRRRSDWNSPPGCWSARAAPACSKTSEATRSTATGWCLDDRPVTVYLVGAGPGDPGLLTVRGAELLSQADVVVYDRLAEPSLLDLAPANAERVDVGKEPGGPVRQDEINALLVDRGQRG